MIQLPNGCSCSEPKISQANWNTKSATTAKDWYIQYRYYDPQFKDQYPNGKFIIVKKGLNYYKTVRERREMCEEIIDELLPKLTRGFNPITGTTITIVEETYEIDPNMPVLEAWEAGRAKIKGIEAQYESDIKSALKFLSISAKQLRLDSIPIKDIRRRHIRMILDNCNKTPGRINKFISHLGRIYSELIELETVDFNPVKEIRKMRVPKKIRPTLTIEQRISIDRRLKRDHYYLWRLMHIFFHSGARKTELVRVKGKDVNLEKQEFKCLIKKGKEWHEAIKVIKDVALPYWVEIMAACKKDDYIFSTYLAPGSALIHADRINKLGKKFVKDAYNIEPDFYSMKHSHTTEVVEHIGKLEAAKHNSHTSTKMVETVYDVDSKSRVDRTVKGLKNTFAPLPNS